MCGDCIRLFESSQKVCWSGIHSHIDLGEEEKEKEKGQGGGGGGGGFYGVNSFASQQSQIYNSLFNDLTPWLFSTNFVISWQKKVFWEFFVDLV